MIEFKPWPKIPRLSNEIYTITEKIDGTNACIVIDDQGNIQAQSRNRLIYPWSDNYGFAQWVEDNKEDLLSLGFGHHYGEWWGRGIGRNYNQTERFFSLFNCGLWGEHNPNTPKCCKVVPILTDNINFENLFGSLSACVISLQTYGSNLEPNYMKPEGMIVYNHLSETYYKVILDK
jgi:hypothetical protein